MKILRTLVILGVAALPFARISASETTNADFKSVSLLTSDTEPAQNVAEETYAQDADNSLSEEELKQLWKQKSNLSLGFPVATLDQKRRYGGKISSRWGFDAKYLYHFYLHKKPIAGMLKFGLEFGINATFLNFANGTFNFSDISIPDIGGIIDDSSFEDTDFSMNLGRQYVTAGIVLGVKATVMPFINSSNRNLARLRFCPFFHVTPSYGAYILSDDEDTEFHTAFPFWCSAGLQIQWRKLNFGVCWKGSTATYKGMIGDIMEDLIPDDTDVDLGIGSSDASKPHKFDLNMVVFSIGVTF